MLWYRKTSPHAAVYAGRAVWRRQKEACTVKNGVCLLFLWIFQSKDTDIGKNAVYPAGHFWGMPK